MKKNNPAFNDEVDEILTDFGGKTSYELSKPTKDVRMKPLVAEARKALDQAYQKKFLERLPKVKGMYTIDDNPHDWYFHKGYIKALSDVKAAIKKEVG